MYLLSQSDSCLWSYQENQYGQQSELEWNLSHESQPSVGSPVFPDLFCHLPISVVTCFLLTTRSPEKIRSYTTVETTTIRRHTKLECEHNTRKEKDRVLFVVHEKSGHGDVLLKPSEMDMEMSPDTLESVGSVRGGYCRYIFYNRTDRLRFLRYPRGQKFKLKSHIDHVLSELGWCVFDRLEVRVHHWPHTQYLSNIIINLLNPPLLEIPQDFRTDSTHTRIQQTVGDPGLRWQDNVNDSMVGHIDEIHILNVVRVSPIVGYLSPSQICESFTLLWVRKLDMEIPPDTLEEFLTKTVRVSVPSCESTSSLSCSIWPSGYFIRWWFFSGNWFFFKSSWPYRWSIDVYYTLTSELILSWMCVRWVGW